MVPKWDRNEFSVLLYYLCTSKCRDILGRNRTQAAMGMAITLRLVSHKTHISTQIYIVFIKPAAMHTVDTWVTRKDSTLYKL